MEREGSGELYRRYKGLIGYAAHTYAHVSPRIDVDDMFQDGCLLLLRFFEGRETTVDLRTHNTFKRSLFLWMKRRVACQVRDHTPNGHKLVRITYDDDSRDRPTINLDAMLAAADTCVLTKLYAREFLAELRRVLCDDERMILDVILENVGDEGPRGEWVRTVAEVLNISVSAVYARIRHIREAALRALSRVA